MHARTSFLGKDNKRLISLFDILFTWATALYNINIIQCTMASAP